VAVGPGDDAAVLAPTVPGGVPPLVVSTDTSVEDVHFRRGWVSPGDAGYRAAVAALSDLAAMGAEPLAVFASLAGTGVDGDDGTLEAVGAGVAEAAREAGASLAGGDVTRSPGPLIIAVTVVGHTPEPWLRSGARPGDELWVSGSLGAAGAAVELLAAGGDGVDPDLRAAFARPPVRAGLARILRAGVPVTSCLDLSDGLIPDAGHLAAASGVRVEVERDAVPVARLARERLDPARAVAQALAGGEDYELCFTVPPGSDAALVEVARESGVPLTRVGRIAEGEGVHLLGPGGEILPSPPPGFSHFSPT
jgi:thiamine-monophosphate kinase